MHRLNMNSLDLGSENISKKNIHELSGNVILMWMVDGTVQVPGGGWLRLRWTILEDSSAPAHGSGSHRAGQPWLRVAAC